MSEDFYEKKRKRLRRTILRKATAGLVTIVLWVVLITWTTSYIEDNDTRIIFSFLAGMPGGVVALAVFVLFPGAKKRSLEEVAGG